MTNAAMTKAQGMSKNQFPSGGGAFDPPALVIGRWSFTGHCVLGHWSFSNNRLHSRADRGQCLKNEFVQSARAGNHRPHMIVWSHSWRKIPGGIRSLPACP